MKQTEAKRRYFSTTDLLTLAVIAVAGGLLAAWIVTPLLRPAAPFFAFLGPLGWIGVSGLYMIAPVLAGLLVCRPGGATLYGVVQGFVEMMFGNPSGALTIVLAGLEGLGADLGLAVFRYRPSLPAALLAGALGNVLVVEFFIFFYGYSTVSNIMVGGLTAALSGALLGGLIAWLLWETLQRAGVVSRLGLKRYEEL